MKNPLINNRYQIETVIGEGAMGTVYRGVDIQSDDYVAIKHLKLDVLASDPDMLERFKREGDALRQLDHPNIVKMLDAVKQDGQHYLIMEYMGGGDLRTLLKGRELLTIRQTLNIALDLADALTRAHRLNIIHRDLKPANILIADDGTLRLTDFGVAHLDKLERVTETGVAIGTLDYLSPEALSGEDIDARTDIWSFGILLFEMLSNQRPFTGTTTPAIILAIIQKSPPDLDALRPDCPTALVDLVYRMLEKDRNARISSVRLVGAELEALIQGTDIDTSSIDAYRQSGTNVFASPAPTTDDITHNPSAQMTLLVGREHKLPLATEKFLKALKHSNPETRHQVILVVGMVDEVAALPILRELHDTETDPKIKQTIVWVGKRLTTLQQEGYTTLDAIFEYFNINAEVMATHDPREAEILRQMRVNFESEMSQQRSRASANQIRNSFLTSMLMGGGIVGGLMMSGSNKSTSAPHESRTEGRIERRAPAARPTDMVIDRWVERLLSDRALEARKKAANSLSDANNPAALPHLARVFRYDSDETMRDMAQRTGKSIYWNTVYWGIEQDGTLQAEMARRREALGLPPLHDPDEKPKNDQPPAEDIAEILRKAEERKRKRR